MMQHVNGSFGHVRKKNKENQEKQFICDDRARKYNGPGGDRERNFYPVTKKSRKCMKKRNTRNTTHYTNNSDKMLITIITYEVLDDTVRASYNAINSRRTFATGEDSRE